MIFFPGSGEKIIWYVVKGLNSFAPRADHDLDNIYPIDHLHH